MKVKHLFHNAVCNTSDNNRINYEAHSWTGNMVPWLFKLYLAFSYVLPLSAFNGSGPLINSQLFRKVSFLATLKRKKL